MACATLRIILCQAGEVWATCFYRKSLIMAAKHFRCMDFLCLKVNKGLSFQGSFRYFVN
jgi:hypothetical protein